MQTINQALEELRSLHQQLNHAPAPEIAPQAFLPFPPGADPVSFALQEVERLKQLVETRSQEMQQPTSPSPSAAHWTPRASVFAGEAEVKFVVELPGVAKEDVAVTLNGPELVVRGERRPSTEEADVRPLFIEQEFGSFERRFPVPGWCKPDGVSARCAQGVLEVTVSRGEDPATGEFSVEIA